MIYLPEVASKQGPKCPSSIDFTLRGERYSLTRDLVVESISGAVPREIKRYYVEIEGTRYPVKQVFELATDLSPADFTTHDAIRILKKLCFEIGREY